MRITSITLRNFRCFGPQATTISLSNLTAFVGTNGCGKSAILQALARLFGIASTDRNLESGDFHVPIGKTLEEMGEADLFVEVRLDFPEFVEANPGDNQDGDQEDVEGLGGTALAECFSHMTVDAEGESPYCRIRMEGHWSPGSLPEGVIEQNVYWITGTAPEPDDTDKQPMRQADRSRIQVLYVPAARDPARQVRQVPGSTLHRLLRAVRWSDDVKDGVEDRSEELADQFGQEDGVSKIEEALSRNWKHLYPSSTYSDVSVRPTAKRFEEILKRVEAIFTPGPGGTELPIDRLSDGMKSLFYLAVVSASFDLCEAAHDAIKERAGDDEEDDDFPFFFKELDPPLLTVFAIEEPENHLAPHYLGRIVSLLRRMAEAEHGQVLLTSHSASILSRVEPEEVRYLRLDDESSTTRVSRIVLPDDDEEAFKFVREAVRAYPELYFARLVVLGEGDSEEIVIPRVAESLKLPIDRSFVSIVPLGGRHVNHFWRLLNDLGIPHISLLDLDRERSGGGWGRIKYACDQLVKVGVSKKKMLALVKDDLLDDEQFSKLHKRPLDKNKLRAWAVALEKYDVFFSQPLDLDFMMLRKFPTFYQETAARGPTIPEGVKDFEKALHGVLAAVLKDGHSGGESYTEEQRKAFFWYRYLFLNRGKPTSHLLALAEISSDELASGSPDIILRLVERMKEKLRIDLEDEGDAG